MTSFGATVPPRPTFWWSSVRPLSLPSSLDLRWARSDVQGVRSGAHAKFGFTSVKASFLFGELMKVRLFHGDCPTCPDHAR